MSWLFQKPIHNSSRTAPEFYIGLICSYQQTRSFSTVKSFCNTQIFSLLVTLFNSFGWSENSVISLSPFSDFLHCVKHHKSLYRSLKISIVKTLSMKTCFYTDVSIFFSQNKVFPLSREIQVCLIDQIYLHLSLLYRS